jgi:hypothetical protein
MLMPKADRAAYSPLDFAQWKAANSLSLTPKFQRRGVWKPKARSFFIDTLLRDMPIPPIYVRQTQSPERNRMIREVVDGQQRISAVLDFMEGEFRLSKTLNAPWAGKSFDKLSQTERDRITAYAFPTEVFSGISDLEVLEVFSRLNTYAVALNAQELRNGQFFGRFKQSVYALGFEHLEFWRRHKIFSEQNVARMLEAEFVSEVTVAFLHGMQDKKKSLSSYYQDYDDMYAKQALMEKRFREVVDAVNESMGDQLAETEFRRPPLLYTVFCVIYHRLHGLPRETISTKRSFPTADRRDLAEAVRTLSDILESSKQGEAVSAKNAAFVTASLRQTDNIQPRKIRFTTLYRSAFM